MNGEKMNERGTSTEQREAEINRMILEALSPVWAKSVQELLPGYLSDKPTSEYTKEELSLFHLAYGLLGEMVKNGKVEVIFEDTTTSAEKTVMDTESTAQAKFKLVTSGGKKENDSQQFFRADVAWEGGVS